MTNSKDAAYCSAVARAFRGDAVTITEYESVPYDLTDSEFLRRSADVLDVLDQLPNEEMVNGEPKMTTVDLDTFAFMLGIGPSALSKHKEKPKSHSSFSTVVPTLGNKTRKSTKPLWTLQQVKAYRKECEKKAEERSDEKSKAADKRKLDRSDAKRKSTMLLEKLRVAYERLRNSNSPTEMKDFAGITVEVIVNANSHLLGFVDLHNLSRDELSDAFRAGARIERTTMRQALTSRTWSNASALQPWINEYGLLVEAFVVRERNLLAASLARSETEEFGRILPAGNTAVRKDFRM